MKNYIRPEMTISLFKTESIMASSGVSPTNTLIDGKENGKPMAESFSSMFGN